MVLLQIVNGLIYPLKYESFPIKHFLIVQIASYPLLVMMHPWF